MQEGGAAALAHSIKHCNVRCELVRVSTIGSWDAFTFFCTCVLGSSTDVLSDSEMWHNRTSLWVMAPSVAPVAVYFLSHRIYWRHQINVSHLSDKRMDEKQCLRPQKTDSMLLDWLPGQLLLRTARQISKTPRKSIGLEVNGTVSPTPLYLKSPLTYIKILPTKLNKWKTKKNYLFHYQWIQFVSKNAFTSQFCDLLLSPEQVGMSNCTTEHRVGLYLTAICAKVYELYE